MDQKIKKISTYPDDKLQAYFDKESLPELHQMKLYVDDIYYNTGKSSGLDDWQYDMLKETLDRRDPDYVVPVGAQIRKHENRVKLPFWLGSMDKFKPEDSKEIAQWLIENKAPQYIIEDKLDGVSCLVIVKNGKIKLYTRGDGEVGADISYLAQYFSSIPKNIFVDLNIRGELIMKKKVFEEKYSSEFANARNMVAGRIGAKTIREGINDIDFVAYELVGTEKMPSPSEQLDYLDKIGFSTVRREIVKNFNIDSLSETLIRFKQTSPYEIDGIIVQPNAPYVRNTSGNPDYAFAFKMRFGSNLVNAKVVGIDWNVSKWGQIKPRVEIEPVKLLGVTITWATGFNAKFIYDNSVGPEAVVQITRSGDVIPYIVNIIKQAPEPDMPEFPYYWNETGVDILTDEYGDEMCIKLISGFFSQIGVKHLGEKNVAKIYEAGYNTLLKIIAASEKDFLQIPGFGERGAERAYANIHNNLKDMNMSTVLGASGVFGFGMGKKKVVALLNDFPDILQVYKNISKKELKTRVLQVDGFSDKSADKIINNVEWADRFVKAMKHFGTFKEKKTSSGNNMQGIIVVFSGFRDTKLEEEITNRGGKVSTSVSSKTSMVVVADKNAAPKGKVKSAMELGKEVLDKQEFIKTYIK